MKNDKKARHHYIPQCYLRYFSSNGKSVFVYNKNRGIYPQSISKVACEKEFYTLSESVINSLKEEEISSDSLEKEFFANSIENQFGTILNKIRISLDFWKSDNKHAIVLEQSDKELFAACIAIQYLRMPNIRDKYWGMETDGNKARLEIIKSFFVNSHPDYKDFINDIEFSIDEGFKSFKHFQIFGNQEFIDSIQDRILDKYWLFFVSEDGGFYTSDNPILLKPHLSNQHPYYEGFGQKGVEVIFPISDFVLLTMWDKSYFPEKKQRDNSFLLIDSKSFRQYNLYQYIWSNFETYNKTGKFGLIKQWKNTNYGNKEIFMPRPKISINKKC